MDHPEEIELALLLEAIYRRYGYDFREYSLTTLRRRVGAAVARLGTKSISGLQGALLHDELFFRRLLDFLTVSTSEMFRDPPFFKSLVDHVFPMLATYPSIRIWVAGCSSGEEVYSLAILLHEEGLLERTLIYATDINPAALSQAREAVYPARDVPVFTRNYQASGRTGRLSDYYLAHYGHAVFERSLREHIVFAEHNLVADAVFSEVQLVMCRNVLIYFNRPLQERTLCLFADSLRHNGFLALGNKETLQFSAVRKYFRDTVESCRIYQKIGEVNHEVA